MKKYSSVLLAQIEKHHNVKIQAFCVNPREGDEKEDNINFFIGQQQYSLSRSEFECEFLRPLISKKIREF